MSTDCSAEPHVHDQVTAIGMMRGFPIVMDGGVVALVFDRDKAERVAQLLGRHGLVDVPDDVSAIAPWGPPTGARVEVLHPNPKLQR